MLSHITAGWGSAATPKDAPTPTIPATVDVPPAAPEPAAMTGGGGQQQEPLIEDGKLERCGLAAMLLFAVQVVVGRRKNAALASGVAAALASLLRRQFAHVGPGPPPARGVDEEEEEGGAPPPSRPALVREAADTFTITASGRRGLGLTSLTIRTRPRHDMLGLMLALFDPASAADTLEVVASLPSGLHPAVLLAGRPLALRLAAAPVADGGAPDVTALAGPVSTAKARCGGAGGGGAWPVGVVASADQPGVWHDLIAGGPLGALLASDPAAARALVCFKASTDGWGGSPRAITASISLPPNPGGGGQSGAVADLGPVARLVEAVLVTADALAAYRPLPETSAKAAKLRAEADERAVRRAAAAAAGPEDATAERRAARLAAEAEKLARMAPDAREKVMARKKRIEERRQLAKRTKRM